MTEKKKQDEVEHTNKCNEKKRRKKKRLTRCEAS